MACSVLTGCYGHGGSAGEMDDFGSMISDSIAEGHINGALKIIRDEKVNAGKDSSLYYRAMAYEAILDYYGGNAKAIMTRADSVLRWLKSKNNPGTDNILYGKAYSAKAGYFTRYEHNPDSNIYYYTKALECFRKNGSPSEVTDAYLNLAGAYKDDGALDYSSDFYGRGIQLADSAHLPVSYRIPLYMGMASTYTAMADYHQSGIWWDKAATLLGDMNVDDKFFYLNNRGNDLFMQKRYHESLKYFLSLDSMLRRHPDLDWEMHFCQANLTDLYLRLGQTAKARSLMDSTERYFTQVQPNSYIQEHIRTQKLQLAVAERKYADVEKMLTEMSSTVRNIRPEQKMERLEFLKDYFARTGQWEKAYKAQTRHLEYTDSIRNANLRLSASERQMRYERDSQLLALHKDLETHRKINSRNYVIGAACLIVITLLAILIVLMRRIASRREEQMMHRIVDLRLKSLRARINPHFIYNALNHEISAQVAGSPSNLDRLVRLLHHQQYMAEELSVSLAEDIAFIDDFVAVEREGISSSFEYVKSISSDIDTEHTRVPSMIIQILVENAFKHGFASLPADATRILRLNVTREDNRTVIDVLNNGAKNKTSFPNSTRQGLKIVDGTLAILNEHNKYPITFSIGQWTDNPQHAGFRATLSIPIDFNFDIHGK